MVLIIGWFKRGNVAASDVGLAFPREKTRDADYMFDLG